MKRFFFFFVFPWYLSACSLIVDFDAHCPDPPDCRKEVCKSTSACTPQPCSKDIMYFDSPPASDCEENQKCFYDNNTQQPKCVNSLWFPEDDDLFYHKCNDNYIAKCPYGSICLESSANRFCLPICNTDTHLHCPNGGKCFYVRNDSQAHFDICLLEQPCDPLDDSGCNSPEMKCYFMFSNGNISTICMIPGNKTAYQECNIFWDCEPGFLCANVSENDPMRCLKLCHNNTNCLLNENCTVFYSGMGVCIPNTPQLN